MNILTKVLPEDKLLNWKLHSSFGPDGRALYFEDLGRLERALSGKARTNDYEIVKGIGAFILGKRN